MNCSSKKMVCRFCEDVISQCRCMNQHEVKFGACVKCLDLVAEGAKLIDRSVIPRCEVFAVRSEDGMWLKVEHNARDPHLARTSHISGATFFTTREGAETQMEEAKREWPQRVFSLVPFKEQS